MTVDEVTTMVLTALGSNSRHNDPNKSDLNELTRNLNYIALAATSSPPRRLPVLDALISADAFHAINTLKGALAERRAAYEDMGRISRSINSSRPYEPTFEEQHAIQALAALDNLNQAIDIATPFLEPWPDAPEWRLDEWGYHASYIAHLFRICLSRENPNISLGISSQGPVARFVVAAVKRIFGEDVKPDTVAQRIKRATKSDRDMRQ